MNCINIKNILCTVNKIQTITARVITKSTFLTSSSVVLNKNTPVANIHITFIRYLGDMAQRNTNRLAFEKSPYLLQHANNPVDWYPWGEEAFTKSLKENKLIFLSIGYSTCHWCHVMERESFENEEIAKFLNENFVCIKVDREERPDVDKLYMLFVQAYAGQCGWPLSVWLQPDLTPVAGGTYCPPHDQFGRPGRGGWPLSVWLTPKLQPIFGGTYFPPKDISGHPGFKSILMILAKQWRDNRQKFSESGQKIMDFIKESSVLDSTGLDLATLILPDISCYKKCYDMLEKSFEGKYGGFGGAPKFPHLVNLNFLFHLYSQQPNSNEGKKALEMCIFSLRMMAKGAIHDHIGQGFARYCIDEKWHLPHFEKMLYDQAQFAVSFASAYLATKDSFFSKVLEDVLLYVNRDLSHPSGGFYCAEDADSLPTPNSTEKKEGAFYVWTYEEIKQILKQKVAEKPYITFADVFCLHYNVQPNGNITSSMDSENEFKNKNVLIVTDDEKTTAEKMQISEDRVKVILVECKKILFEHRTKRPRPHLDDKILTSWNGLMISGLAKAGQALGNTNYVQRAIGVAKFIRQYLYKNDSKTLLRSCYKDSDNAVIQITKPINGFLDDYAYVIRGLLDLYEASFDPTWIEWAETLQETQDQLFWDEGGAGYFSSPSGDSSILVRMKEDHDGVEPSGNSVSVHNLLRLGAYLDRNDCRERAGKVLTAFKSRLSKMPVTLPEMISGLMFFHDGPTQIIITGKPDAPDTAALLNVVHSRLIPNRVLVLVGEDKENILYKKNDIIKTIKSIGGRSTAYVCRHHTCSLPVTTREELAKHLDNPK